jgi:hypothetical protein
VVQVSNAPEGLFVSVPTAYESLLASNPSEAAEHKQAGWRRATRDAQLFLEQIT